VEVTKLSLVGADASQTFDLREGSPMVVGRGLSSDLPVPDPTISRRHAEVLARDGVALVRDLGSSNGTYHDQAPVGAEQVIVRPGETVTFGKVVFTLRTASVERASPPSPGPGFNPGATIVRSLPVDLKEGLAAALRSGPQRRVTPDGTPAELSPSERAQERLTTLLEVSTELTKQVSVDALLQTIADKCTRIFMVDRVAILLADAEGNLQAKLATDRKGQALGAMVPQSIARASFDEKQAILSENAAEDQRFQGQSIVMQQVRSAICAPLVGSENRALGVIYVDSVLATHRFEEGDLDYLVAFSGIAAVALENSQFAERIRKETLARSNLERFFTPALAERIAQSPDAVKLGGDKRMVAVLFSDIRGFTALSETMNPDDMARLLSEYFTEMVDCVFRHGGTLDKFIGDAVMAQWGAPLGEPDDADRAMRAALDMMRSLAALNRRWRDQGRPELAIGIGLNCGEAFAGNIGSERRLEFTVIGDVVNTASRLCGAAEGGEILMSEPFQRAMRDAVPVNQHDPMELKGKSQPVPVWSVDLPAMGIEV
jgi:adenylate cyclase